MISPLLLLAVLCGVTALAAVFAATGAGARAAALKKLADQWGMRYVPDDRFELAARVAEKLPTPGVADVVVRDLVFSQDERSYRFFFTVEFTTGIIRAKRRHVRTGMVVESAQPAGGPGFSEVVLAPDDLDTAAQYQWLHERASHFSSASGLRM